jgi:hypothetical protein
MAFSPIVSKAARAKLEEAVAAFREALKERTRERVPLEWAGTHNNLRIVLVDLAERDGGNGEARRGGGCVSRSAQGTNP